MLITQEFTVKVDDQIVLNDLNLDFGPGVHVIMGPNGVGKSTFAHALMGNPNYITEGAVEFYGKTYWLCLHLKEPKQECF